MQEYKYIRLVNDGRTLVSPEDYDELSKHRWFRTVAGYASRQGWKDDSGNRIGHWEKFMHREVNRTPDGLFTDHINGNKLDNRRSNLRTVNKSQNSANRPKIKVKRVPCSQYKGVWLHKGTGYWVAGVQCDGKDTRTYHKTELQAALDYNRLAGEAFGRYAQLNELPEGIEPTIRKPKTSKHKGVSYHAKTGKWRATIELGRFDDEDKAAEAYRMAAEYIRGSRKPMNTP